MAKPEWGTKRVCQSCGARFYDLRRDPIICPICGAVFDPERHPKVRRGGGVVRDQPVLVPELEEPELTEAALGDDAAGEEDVADVDDIEDPVDPTAKEDLSADDGDLIEDTSDLGEDDDDIGEVMEHVDDDLDDKR